MLFGCDDIRLSGLGVVGAVGLRVGVEMGQWVWELEEDDCTLFLFFLFFPFYINSF